MDGHEVYGKTWIRSPATPWEYACRTWAFDVEEMAAFPHCKNKRVRWQDFGAANWSHPSPPKSDDQSASPSRLLSPIISH